MKRTLLLLVFLFPIVFGSNMLVSGMSGNNINMHVQSDNQVILYPNPATTVLNIQFYTEKEGTAKIKFFNALGSVVFSNKYDFNQGNVLISISLENNKIKPGMYYVQIDNGQFSSTQKLIVK